MVISNMKSTHRHKIFYRTKQVLAEQIEIPVALITTNHMIIEARLR